VFVLILGSFSIDDGHGSENVTIKMNSRFFDFFTRLFQNAENANVGGFLGTVYSSLERERKFVVACLRPPENVK